MQIIIVQAEIEAAIRNYINNQLQVKDGHRIDIELSATRGADGFKATIDIVAANAPSLPKGSPEVDAAPAPAPAPTPSPAKAEVAVVRSVISSPAPAPKPETAAKDPEAAQALSTDGAAAEAGAASNASAETAQEGAADAGAKQDGAPVVEVEAKPARSLFAGLKKSVNA